MRGLTADSLAGGLAGGLTLSSLLRRFYLSLVSRLSAALSTVMWGLPYHPTPDSRLCHTTRNASPSLRSVKGVNRAILDRSPCKSSLPSSHAAR